MDIDQEMKSLVCELITHSVAGTYPYHNKDHTLYVFEKTIEIAAHEQCTASDLRLLKAAALWHDTGYSNTFVEHHTH